MQMLPSKRAAVLRAPLYLLAPLLLVYLSQDRLLHHPTPLTAAEGRAAVADGLKPWPDARTARGWLAEPKSGAVRATLVLFHGNAGNAAERQWYARALLPLGVRVVLAELPGYGGRKGDLDEPTLVADAAQTLALARARFGAPLLVAGESLGAGVAAAAVARRGQDCTGVLMITPWDRLEHVASHHFPWLPVTWLLRDTYDSAANLANYRGPVAVVLARRDSVVPVELGRAFVRSLHTTHRVDEVDSDHGDWASQVPEGWWAQVVEFLLRSGA